MRQALSEAWRHVRARHAFGRCLAEQPLMRTLLADMALEVEAGVALTLRTARAFDGAARATPMRPPWPACCRHWPSTGTTSVHPAFWPKPWNASAASAMWRNRRWHGSIAKRR
nr:acyl-CoA dehydrogenase family protein [Halomonas elongata]